MLDRLHGLQFSTYGKGSVENAIQHTQSTALKGRRFDSLQEQNEFLEHWECNWAAKRIHGREKRQVQAMFEQERASLTALPLASFAFFEEMQTVYSIDSLKNKWVGKMRKAEFWLTRLVDKFEAAQNMGVDTAVLNETRTKHSEAHIHWEWWSATNGGHFHNPQQFEESINKGMAISQAGVKLLDDAMAKRRTEAPGKNVTSAAPAAGPAGSIGSVTPAAAVAK